MTKAIDISVKLTGARELTKALDKLRKQAPRAFAAALYQQGLRVMADSQMRVPVDTNRLRSTAYCAPPTDPEDPFVECGYDTDYALAVHERTELRHRTGEAKYLKNAVDHHRRTWTRDLAALYRKAAKRGIGVTPLAAMPTSPQDSARTGPRMA